VYGRGDGAGGSAAAVDLDSARGVGEPVGESLADLKAPAEDLERDGQSVSYRIDSSWSRVTAS
jgi:hypothetical protein